MTDFLYKEPGVKELDALDFAEGVTDNSRLGCQMKVSRGCQDKEFIFVEG